jgi:hypothetical protein
MPVLGYQFAGVFMLKRNRATGLALPWFYYVHLSPLYTTGKIHVKETGDAFDKRNAIE